MLNKKAIAALAAGATLVSGLAFAAPAMAKDETKAPKTEECKVDPKNVAKLERELNKAEGAVYTAEDKANTAKENYEKQNEQLVKAQGVVKAYNDALKAYKEAKFGEKKDDFSANEVTKRGTALTNAIKAVNDYNTNTPVAMNALKVAVDSLPANVAAVNADTAELKAPDAPSRTELLTANDDLNTAKENLKKAQDALAKAQCKTTPAPAPQPGPKPGPQNPVTLPTVVADPTTKDEAINATRLAAMVLQNAENDLAKKN
ncbi:hypothetical protein ACMZ7M_06605, partial [Gardnerella vaginalis]